MQKNRGFTLVELSIVLVILGLLVGGVLAGQSMVKSAELRSIITEHDKFATALNAFQEKYNALPGDMATAYNFWSTGCVNSTAISNGCNGDGDGQISALNGEMLKAWAHLSRAGLIEGSYDGLGGVFSPTNMPKSKFSQGFWSWSNMVSDGDGADVSGAIWLEFGGNNAGGAGEIGQLASIKNEEAWNVDVKMDDGHAHTGSVRGDSRANCFDIGTDYYAIQDQAATPKGNCALHFQM